jgi:hypothetical protein
MEHKTCADLKTNVCSCSRPWSSSSTTTSVSFFFLKSNFPILGLQQGHSYVGGTTTVWLLVNAVQLINTTTAQHSMEPELMTCILNVLISFHLKQNKPSIWNSILK